MCEVVGVNAGKWWWQVVCTDGEGYIPMDAEVCGHRSVDSATDCVAQQTSHCIKGTYDSKNLGGFLKFQV